MRKERKERSDKGKKRVPDNYCHIQARLNGNKGKREMDAIRAWKRLVGHYGNSRLALTEIIILAEQSRVKGWLAAPPQQQLDANVQQMLGQAMQLIDRLSNLEFAAPITGQAQTIKGEAQAFSHSVKGMMGDAVFFDEDEN